MITVNGYAAEPGCVLDSHRGQYIPDDFAEVLEGFDLLIDPDDDPRVWRRVAERADELAYQSTGLRQKHLVNKACDAWCWHHEAADALIDIANEATEGGIWRYWEGDVRLDDWICAKCGRDSREDDDNACDECWDAYD